MVATDEHEFVVQRGRLGPLSRLACQPLLGRFKLAARKQEAGVTLIIVPLDRLQAPPRVLANPFQIGVYGRDEKIRRSLEIFLKRLTWRDELEIPQPGRERITINRAGNDRDDPLIEAKCVIKFRTALSRCG